MYTYKEVKTSVEERARASSFRLHFRPVLIFLHSPFSSFFGTKQVPANGTGSSNTCRSLLRKHSRLHTFRRVSRCRFFFSSSREKETAPSPLVSCVQESGDRRRGEGNDAPCMANRRWGGNRGWKKRGDGRWPCNRRGSRIFEGGREGRFRVM